MAITVTGTWTLDEAERFLQSTAVPLRLGCRRPGDDLWMLSLWYRYVDGVFECATAATADVVRFLEYDPSVSFEISTNEPPYCGVRGNGTATVEPDEEKAVLRSLLERYLDGTDSPLADRLLSSDRREVTITVDPDRLYTWDYSNRM